MTWTIQPRSEGAGALHYIGAGDGPPLVLIHGVGLRAEAWQGMIPYLARHFKTYAVDMPGHGSSPLNDARALPDYVARVRAFLAALDAPCHIAGHSMGAMIALQVAGGCAGQIRGVAALNAIYRREEAAAKAVRARAAALKTSGRADPSATLQRWFGTDPEGALLHAAEACRGWLTETDLQGYARAYNVFAQSDGPSDTLLQSLTMPALFMTGADDPNSTPEMSRRMAANSAKGHSLLCHDAAHMMPMTHPQEVSAAMIRHLIGEAP
ncbi:alpha/beta hydrolase [uncultured Roseobacter sp.]|uniref:alpha/beta fold hydrolase n=1 Tax=uncultured Roseobacter sp. TaxID=114847 RepID=UPI00262A0460|nr:alpha/beta hydrolase [uncultured Roseobacter sp.]